MPPDVTVTDRYSVAEIEGFYEAGFWQDKVLFELVRRQAAERGDKVYVLDSTTSLTYAELYERAVRLAAGLQRLGVSKGDRVAVQLPNWTELVVIVVALSRLGAVLVPIMPIYREADVGYVLKHSGARVGITCEEFKRFRHVDMFTALAAGSPDLRHVVAVRPNGPLPDSVHAFDDLVVTGDAAELDAALGPLPSADDPFLIIYTSGTTSRPKGCLHTFNTAHASAAIIGKSLGYSESDVQFGPSPITHATGAVTSILLPLLYGASSYLMEAWDPAEALRQIEKHGCTVAVTATAFIQMLMGAYERDRNDVSSMRLWVCAGSPIPASVVTSASTMFAGLRVLSLYGRSENFLTTMCTVDDPPERSSTSDGSALAGASVKVVGEHGRELPRGTEGDIAYQGPSHMLAYYRDEEQTAALFTPDGHSRSGDLGVMDADGYVRVTGRLKDIVIRGGLNISARELEDYLVEHPAIGNVAIVGMPDERLGEKVCAYVVVAAGQPAPALADITSYLRERHVATPKLPERLEIVDELPMTATGKVKKHELRSDIAAKLAAG